MNDRAHGPWLQPEWVADAAAVPCALPDAEDLALLQTAAAAWAPWLPGWADELAAQAAGAPGWLPPGRPRYAIGAEPSVAERVLQRLSAAHSQPPEAWAALQAAWRLCAAVPLCPTLAAGLRRETGLCALTPEHLALALRWPLHRLLPLLARNPLRELGLLVPAEPGLPLALQGLQVPDDMALALWQLRPSASTAPAFTDAPAPSPALAALARALRSPVPVLALWVDASGRGPAPESVAPPARRIQDGPGLAAALGRCLVDEVLPMVVVADDAGGDPEALGAGTAGPSSAPLQIPAAYPGPVLVLARRANIALDPGTRPLLVQHAEPPAAPAQARTWATALALPPSPAAQAWAQQLARTLPLPAAACEQAATDARLAATLAGRAPGHADLLAAARHRAALAVQGAVDLRSPRATLAELVLPATAQAALQHALRLFEHRPEAGLRLLLAGPPGTGKTFAAEAIAHALQRDLLVVDAGRVLSRWLGETERRLEQAFSAAETARALLFIDEADALFARRTEVKDAHDRYANAETAYLLQRLERFHGVLVLASNARGSIDTAFTRRFDAVLAFDEPDEAVRARLWAQMLGPWPTAPLPRAEAVTLLARWYPMTGAQIRSACRAAPAEAGALSEPGLAPLLQAVAREFHKAGRSFPGLPTLPRGLSPAETAAPQPDPLT
ncbi:ATP-binding protein [Rubrivivax rivuli]|uniref:ATP-binding protein n=1 Tax=Rubrivivax rivuli TaxID=1862385 RepID=A0A437RHN7_9BURK|nr:ATP-binding protein [Rubrivivax rivuli]RVU46225.1 ATP-binding protein [Rubrivivax rivuli]